MEFELTREEILGVSAQEPEVVVTLVTWLLASLRALEQYAKTGAASTTGQTFIVDAGQAAH